MAATPGELPRSVQPAGDSPAVTVLIAAYNAADFISRAIGSALDQGLPDVEVLVVDDCSTDDTREVVRRLSAGDERVRLVELTTNGGPAVARNAGLERARGAWVAVLDADDAYLPGRLPALIQLAGRTDADVVADNFRFYHAQDQRIGEAGMVERPGDETVDAPAYLERSHAYGEETDWGLLKPMFRRAFLDEHALRYPSHSRHGEDFLFLMDILLSGGRFAVTREPFYLYTTRDSGMSRTSIDYDAMWRQSQTLLADPRVQRSEPLRQAVALRIERVRRYAAERTVVPLIMSRDLFGLCAVALRNPWARAVLARRLFARGRKAALRRA